MRSCWSV